MKLTKITILSLFLFLTNCAKLTAEQCANSNWQQVGYQDGNQGKQMANLDTINKQCQRYNITIDNMAYREGYRQGVISYCQPTFATGEVHGSSGVQWTATSSREGFCAQNGVQLNLAQYRQGYDKGINKFCTFNSGKQVGARGQDNPYVCPKKIAHAFDRGWQQGINIYCSDTKTAYSKGRANNDYPSLCSLSKYPGYFAAYQAGLTLYKRIVYLENALAETSKELENTKKELEKIAHPKSKRANQLRADIRHLEKVYKKQQDELRVLQVVS